MHICLLHESLVDRHVIMVFKFSLISIILHFIFFMIYFFHPFIIWCKGDTYSVLIKGSDLQEIYSHGGETQSNHCSNV
jgi:hypothetical protein